MSEDLIPHDTRTREERQLDCLRDLLARPNWSGPETLEILAGLDPDLSPSREKVGWWLLPGTPADLHDEEMKDRFTRLGRIAALRETIPPVDAIRAALAAGYSPPWLEVARFDQECRLWMPPELFGEVPLTITEVAARGGRAKAELGEQAKLRKACELSILAMLREDPKMKGSEIIDALEIEFGSDNIKASTVYEWLPKLRKAATAPKDSGF